MHDFLRFGIRIGIHLIFSNFSKIHRICQVEIKLFPNRAYYEFSESKFVRAGELNDSDCPIVHEQLDRKVYNRYIKRSHLSDVVR